MTINTHLLAQAFPHSIQLDHSGACYIAGVLSGGRLCYAVTPHPVETDQRVIWMSDLARQALLDFGGEIPAGHGPRDSDDLRAVENLPPKEAL